jgi:hypothetical protein
VRILEEDFGHTVVDYSVSGATVVESLAAYREAPADGDFAIIAHGITEPVVRPHPDTLRWAPKRWQRRGWTDPRAYYSTRLPRRWLERAESAARWRVKNLAIRSNSMQLNSLHEYLDAHRQLRDALAQRGTIALSLEPTHIDPRYFPRSDAEQMRYWDALQATSPRAVGTRDTLAPWDDYLLDHFHPNQSGHVKLANLIQCEVTSRGQ